MELDEDGNLYALDAHTGAKPRTCADGGPVGISAPLNGWGSFILAADYDNVYALRASNGALLWHYETGSFVNGLAVTDGMVLERRHLCRTIAFDQLSQRFGWCGHDGWFATGGPIDPA